MMNKGCGVCVAAWCLMAVVVVLVAEVQQTAAANCNPAGLTPCLGSITGSGKPSAECCSKLKEQETCLCDYLKTPAFKPYIDSPKAHEVAQACGVSYPKC